MKNSDSYTAQLTAYVEELHSFLKEIDELEFNVLMTDSEKRAQLKIINEGIETIKSEIDIIYDRIKITNKFNLN